MMPSWTTVIAGRKGGGKSGLMQDLVLSYLDERPNTRFVVRDSSPEGEWRAFKSKRLLWLPSWEYEGPDAVDVALDWGDCTYVDDEADLIFNCRRALMPDTPEHTLMHRGRHFGVAMMLAGRSTGNLSLDVRRNADTVFLFRHREPQDLAWIEDCCGEDWAAAARSLPPYQWLRCNL